MHTCMHIQKIFGDWNFVDVNGVSGLDGADARLDAIECHVMMIWVVFSLMLPVRLMRV